MFIYVSCFTLIIDYIYEVIHDICLVVYDYVKSKIYFVLLVFSTHAFMCLLKCFKNIQVDSVVLLSTLATDR